MDAIAEQRTLVFRTSNALPNEIARADVDEIASAKRQDRWRKFMDEILSKLRPDFIATDLTTKFGQITKLTKAELSSCTVHAPRIQNRGR